MIDIHKLIHKITVQYISSFIDCNSIRAMWFLIFPGGASALWADSSGAPDILASGAVLASPPLQGGQIDAPPDQEVWIPGLLFSTE